MYNQKEKIVGISKIKEAWKNYNVEIIQVKLENGTITGTFEGVEKMNQSNKKITNQDIMNSIMLLGKRIDDIEIKFEKRFEDMETKFEKRFEDMETKFEKRFDKIDAKIDLIIACPTIQSEINHEALAKIDLKQ